MNFDDGNDLSGGASELDWDVSENIVGIVEAPCDLTTYQDDSNMKFHHLYYEHMHFNEESDGAQSARPHIPSSRGIDPRRLHTPHHIPNIQPCFVNSDSDGLVPLTTQAPTQVSISSSGTLHHNPGQSSFATAGSETPKISFPTSNIIVDAAPCSSAEDEDSDSEESVSVFDAASKDPATSRSSSSDQESDSEECSATDPPSSSSSSRKSGRGRPSTKKPRKAVKESIIKRLSNEDKNTILPVIRELLKQIDEGKLTNPVAANKLKAALPHLAYRFTADWVGKVRLGKIMGKETERKGKRPTGRAKSAPAKKYEYSDAQRKLSVALLIDKENTVEKVLQIMKLNKNQRSWLNHIRRDIIGEK
jgi:hypothetical protein